MIQKYFLIFLASIFFLLPFSSDVFAASEDAYPHFKLSGFGTLGVVNGGDETLGFQRD